MINLIFDSGHISRFNKYFPHNSYSLKLCYLNDSYKKKSDHYSNSLQGTEESITASKFEINCVPKFSQ